MCHEEEKWNFYPKSILFFSGDDRSNSPTSINRPHGHSKKKVNKGKTRDLVGAIANRTANFAGTFNHWATALLLATTAVLVIQLLMKWIWWQTNKRGVWREAPFKLLEQDAMRVAWGETHVCWQRTFHIESVPMWLGFKARQRRLNGKLRPNVVVWRPLNSHNSARTARWTSSPGLILHTRLYVCVSTNYQKGVERESRD